MKSKRKLKAKAEKLKLKNQWLETQVRSLQQQIKTLVLNPESQEAEAYRYATKIKAAQDDLILTGQAESKPFSLTLEQINNLKK